MLIGKQHALDYHNGARPENRSHTDQTLPHATRFEPCLHARVAEPCLDIQKTPSWRLNTPAREIWWRSSQRHGRARPGKHRSSRGQAGHGRQGRALQALCRYRRLRPGGEFRQIPTRSSAFASFLSPRSAGSTWKTSRRPSVSRSSRRLRKTMSIPVFHDDQHGTAIISGAALLNALEVVGKDIRQVRVVFNGAGARESPARSTTSTWACAARTSSPRNQILQQLTGFGLFEQTPKNSQ